MIQQITTLMVLLFFSISNYAADSLPQEIPLTFEQMWMTYDPEIEPLNIEIVKSWNDQGITCQYVLFDIGVFKGVKSRLAGFYAFPENGEQCPGILHIHGGGQRAFFHEASYFAREGYAVLSINWGGRPMEIAWPMDESELALGLKPFDDAPDSIPNTSWGAVEATQKNVPGFFNFQPGELYCDPVESPRNNNWFLLTLACRRSLTFLSQQPQVDPQKLGVHGFSMGGTLTMYTAGADHRVKAAVPAVGGSGYDCDPLPMIPESKGPYVPNASVDLYRKTMGHETYAAHVRCPLFYLSAANDFNGIMDNACRTCRLVPARFADGTQAVAWAFAPHWNHRLPKEFEVNTLLWYECHLKNRFNFPSMPEFSVELDTPDQIPRLILKPDRSLPIEKVVFYASFDPCPTARFWRTLKTRMEDHGTVFCAGITDIPPNKPLFAYANVFYRLPKDVHFATRGTTDTMAISSDLFSRSVGDLATVALRTTNKSDEMIESFSEPLEDWMVHEKNNRDHWCFETRKLNDPRWISNDSNDRLLLELKSDAANMLAVSVTVNDFREYRGRMKTYYAQYLIQKTDDTQRIVMNPGDFKTEVPNETPEVLESWSEVDVFSFAAHYRRSERTLGTYPWNGSMPEWQSLSWLRNREKNTWNSPSAVTK